MKSRRSSKSPGFFRSLDPIDQLSIPLFIITMVWEHRRLRNVPHHRVLGDLRDSDEQTLSGTQLPSDELVPLGYERKDTVASLSMLVGSVAVNLATMSALDRLNRRLFKRRISAIGSRRGSLLGAMVLWDFLYYWEHRFMHVIRVFWAHHVSHHSSERYNLSTALRQPWSSFLMQWVFVPMPLLGFPAAKVRRAAQLNLLYQYWIHTEVVDRLPAKAEAILNTPSHHRVHHGANRQYLDKNYGGILIVWDKLFGTFEPEVRRVKYGLTKNISTFNPVRIAYHEFASLARDVARARSWRERVRYIFGRPGWQLRQDLPDMVAGRAAA
jgi:sterol desaturase/sphingolipid hydroxylase (fatty acid hydroxylase superfamily)